MCSYPAVRQAASFHRLCPLLRSVLLGSGNRVNTRAAAGCCRVCCVVSSPLYTQRTLKSVDGHPMSPTHTRTLFRLRNVAVVGFFPSVIQNTRVVNSSKDILHHPPAPDVVVGVSGCGWVSKGFTTAAPHVQLQACQHSHNKGVRDETSSLSTASFSTVHSVRHPCFTRRGKAPLATAARGPPVHATSHTSGSTAGHIYRMHVFYA